MGNYKIDGKMWGRGGKGHEGGFKTECEPYLGTEGFCVRGGGAFIELKGENRALTSRRRKNHGLFKKFPANWELGVHVGK